jgi:hypothetical protein
MFTTERRGSDDDGGNRKERIVERDGVVESHDAEETDVVKTDTVDGKNMHP